MLSVRSKAELVAVRPESRAGRIFLGLPVDDDSAGSAGRSVRPGLSEHGLFTDVHRVAHAVDPICRWQFVVADVVRSFCDGTGFGMSSFVCVWTSETF